MADVEKDIGVGFDLLGQGEFNKAKLRFNKVIKASPDDPRGYIGMAQAAAGLPKMSMVEVAELYRKAIALDSDNPLLYIEYGEYCLENGLLRPAEENYLKAVELDKYDAPFFYNDLAFGFADSGIKFIERQVISKDEVVKKALEFRMKAFDMDTKDTVKVLKKLEKESSTVAPEKYNDKAVKKIEGAAELMDMLKKEEGNPYLRLELGQLCCDAGYIICGERFFLDAVGIDPENAKYYYNDLSAGIFFGGMANLGKAEAKEKEDIHLSAWKYALRAIKVDATAARELLE